MISAVVLTKNEESNIEKCLQSLSWCDETIIIDDKSDDKTVAIAKKVGATVYSRSMYGDFSAQRNYALEKVKGDWVLFVDADERVSQALWYEIMSHINESINSISGYYLYRQDTMLGKVLKYGETGNIKLLRLAKRDSGTWKGAVHERWEISGQTETLKNPLDHFPHPTLTDFFTEINFYTDLRAQELYDKKTQVKWPAIIAYPVGKFIVNYFFKRGFMDGIQGFVLAMIMSLHSFLVRAKLWRKWQDKS